MLSNRITVLLPLLMTLVLSVAYAGPKAPPAMAEHTATVLEHMDSGGYTYIRAQEGQQEYWVAATTVTVKVGDKVRFTEQMWMADFTSKTLGRTFDRVMFVSGLMDASLARVAPIAIQQKSLEPVKAPVMAVSEAIIAAGPAEDHSVADVFAKKDSLKGKSVRVKGKVVKVSKNIMGRTWVHIEDGSGSEGSNKLIFRSKTGSAAVGETITAQGRVDTNLDFGYGYTYAVLVEDAVFTR